MPLLFFTFYIGGARRSGLPKSIEELFGKRSRNGAKLPFDFIKRLKAQSAVTSSPVLEEIISKVSRRSNERLFF